MKTWHNLTWKLGIFSHIVSNISVHFTVRVGEGRGVGSGGGLQNAVRLRPRAYRRHSFQNQSVGLRPGHRYRNPQR